LKKRAELRANAVGAFWTLKLKGAPMGMFDYVDWQHVLPAKTRRESAQKPVTLYQTKSVMLWDNPMWRGVANMNGALRLTVTRAGELLDPNMMPYRWTGVMVFYGPYGKDWIANFVDGQLESVKRKGATDATA
jgi:hypothetical protein